MTYYLLALIGYAAAMALSLAGEVQAALLVVCTLIPLAIAPLRARAATDYCRKP